MRNNLIGIERGMRCVLRSILVVLSSATIASAAPNGEITVVPLGGTTIKSGVQTISLRLSGVTQGQMVQPLVLIAAQPSVEVPPAAPVVVEANASPQMQQVPATISIEVDGKKLPDWVLSAMPTAYVINRSTIQRNPEFVKGRLAVTMHLKSDAADARLVVLGMPDAGLSDRTGGVSADGPLSEFARTAKSEDVRKYFDALAMEIAGDREAALTAYRALSDSNEVDVARFARRGRRMLEYSSRERQLSGNFIEHYRWALYLQFCGLYRPAFDEFEECRIIHPAHAEAQYRAGECQGLMYGDLMKILQYVDRTEENAPAVPQSKLDVLVVIIKARDGREPLSKHEVTTIADQCFITKKMVAAATTNAVQIEFQLPVADDATAVGLTTYGDGVQGPAADRLDGSAHYDAVITVLARLPDEAADTVRFTTGGPGGAAMATIFHDGNWHALSDAVYRVLRSSVTASGIGTTMPPAEHALTAGHTPSPHMGFSARSALHYSLPRNAYLGLGWAGESVDESYLQLWRLVEASESAGADGSSLPFPSPGADAERTVVIDGRRVAFESTNGHSTRAFRATNWVYVPNDQIVQFRVDTAGQTAVWVNGDRVRDGSAHRQSGTIGQSIFSGVGLKRGWNRLDVNCWTHQESGPPSFAASLLTTDDKPIPGLAQSHTLPDKYVVSPDADRDQTYYQWNRVAYDWQRKLPVVDIASITHQPGANITAQLAARDGFIAVDLPGRADGAGYRKSPANWNAESDRDVAFNNVLDWRREWCLGVQCADGRQLLFVRPAAVEAVIFCLKEDNAATEKAFRGLELPDRILGRVVVPADDFDRELIVFDVRIGDPATWPHDEEDLLTPFGPFIPNSIYVDPVGPPRPNTAD